MSKLKLLVASLLIGALFSPVAVNSRQTNDAAQYADNDWDCSQTVATVDVSATAPTQMNFINDGPDEVYIQTNGNAATVGTGNILLNSGEAYSFTLRDNYVRTISCIANTGETAVVRVGGHR